MADPSRVARKAEEAAARRSQAVRWLESTVGPLGIPAWPSEREFVACLRSGLVLCNAVNKIQPGAVSKVIENPVQGVVGESQPLPAYQYFENVRNFLVAVEELKLPVFEASDLERDALDAGSTTKIVDCVLGLKAYQEWRQCGGECVGGIGAWKHLRSPIVPHMIGSTHSRAIPTTVDSRRHLDLSGASQEILKGEDQTDAVVKSLVDNLFDAKENVDHNLLRLLRNGNQDRVKFFYKIMSSCLEEDCLGEYLEHFKTDTGKGNINRMHLLETHEKELKELKALLAGTKKEFEALQFQLQSDLTQLNGEICSFSAAARGYQVAVKENRKLYNMLQDLKGNIKVYCRIKPSFNAGVKSVIDFIGSDGSLMIVDPLKPSRKSFQFNKVFGPTATQEEIYKDTQTLIRSVMDGYNVCIFAYGQTGSGKTHTMCGPLNGEIKDMGINYMAMSDLFEISSVRKNTVRYEVRVQMVEIYNEQVRDLLPDDSSSNNNRLEIRSCLGNGGICLPDGSMHLVESTMDVLNLMELGEKNRSVSSTAINDRSSRSHSVLIVHVQGQEISGSTLRSCLHLVDLAGSERVDKSEVTGDRLKEAQHINKSLSCLGDVISALGQKSSHIPYRNSKLTQLLQDSLGGKAKVLMLAHVSPEADFYGETISTLKFAQRVSSVELGTAHVNKESNEIRELKEQVDSLKQALAVKDGEGTLQSRKFRETRPENLILTTERSLRPRRLSIENYSVPKNEQLLKTPLVRPKAEVEYTPVRFRRLSLEGTYSANKDQTQNQKLDVQTRCHDLDTGLENGNNLTSESQASKIVRTRTSLPLPKTPEPLNKVDEAISSNEPHVTTQFNFQVSLRLEAKDLT
ncbi:Kinesin-4 [Acorus calamus]|uniref:Kinesin-4 n=1 Tax=Acorus calamus TaxID=4465 RepID=A0AAV9D021_ACOCL|nr:Kinesin-4 [Acorus calamus]